VFRERGRHHGGRDEVILRRTEEKEAPTFPPVKGKADKEHRRGRYRRAFHRKEGSKKRSIGEGARSSSGAPCKKGRDLCHRELKEEGRESGNGTRGGIETSIKD